MTRSDLLDEYFFPGVTDEQRALRDRARKFADEIVRPVGEALDAMSSDDAAGPSSPIWDFLREAHRLGFTRMGVSRENGGLGMDPVSQYIVLEEVATGDAGLVAVMTLGGFPFQTLIDMRVDPALIQRYAVPYFRGDHPTWVGCWGATEPAHGSDALSGHTPSYRQPSGQLQARIDGDQIVLNGEKSGWVSGAPLASHAVVNVALPQNRNTAAGGVVFVPMDTPGVMRGRPIDKLGLRALPQGSLHFADVRLPRSHLLVSAEKFESVLRGQHRIGALVTAVMALGAGIRALRMAEAWAGTRVQGGRLIREHQLVQHRVFRMYTLVQAARSLVQGTYSWFFLSAGRRVERPLAQSFAAKVFAANSCFEAVDIGLQLTAARGLLRAPTGVADPLPGRFEKLFRDAKSYRVADGENGFLTLLGGAALLGCE